MRMMNKYNGRRSHGWVPAPVCNTRVTKIFKYLHGEVANSEYEVRPAASLCSEDLGKAGWAYAVLIGGDAIGDEGASLASEGYGPVVTSFGCAPSLTSARVSILTTRRN